MSEEEHVYALPVIMWASACICYLEGQEITDESHADKPLLKKAVMGGMQLSLLRQGDKVSTKWTVIVTSHSTDHMAICFPPPFK